MNRIFNSEIECSNEIQRLKLLQKHHPLRPEVIPPELANSSQWIVWAYEVGGRKNGKFGPDKIAYQARNPSLKSSKWYASDWSDLTTALLMCKDNPHIDGIGYFFSKNDGLTGIDFDNCRDPKTGRIRKEYQFWIDKLDGYTEVSPSGTGIKVWVKGTIDSKYFRNDESTGFRIQNFAGGIIEIYRRGQYFTVTTQLLEGFEHIKQAQEELDVLSAFYLSHVHNNLLVGSGGWISGEQAPNVVENLPKSAKKRLGTGYLTGKIVYSPDGTQLVVPKSTGIWVYDPSTFEVIDLISEHRAFNSTEIRNDQGCELSEVDNAVGFSSEGKLFAVRVAWQYCVLPQTSEIYTIRIWSREIEQPELISIKCPEKIDSMVFSPDGLTLAGSKDGTIYLWNVHTGELQNILTLEAKKVDSMVFSPDGLTLASTSWVGTGQFGISPDGDTYESIHSFIDVWDTRTGTRKFNLYADSLLGFSPDGQMLAGRIYGDSVALWKANTGRCKFAFTHYPPSVLYSYPPTSSQPYTDTSPLGSAASLAFSPDGLTLASFSDDTIYLWDYHTGNCKSTFTGIDYITSLVFSPDGCTLAGGCKDGTVLLWDIDGDNNETVLKEKDTEFQNRASQIQQFCEDRGITTLCHFTRVENLHSILQQGLLGRNLLEARGQQFLWNDPDRADGHKEAVCLSISFPNYQMFYSIRESEKTKGVKDSQWVILLLDPKVLWELGCAFCQDNAARTAISSIPLEDRKKTEALKDMFKDFYNIRHQDLSIPQDYPTHPQAEVLVFDSIPARYIKAIHFWDTDAQNRWLPSSTGTNYETVCTDRHYFKYRSDYEIWRREKFNNKGIPLSYTAENNVDDFSVSIRIDDEDDILF